LKQILIKQLRGIEIDKRKLKRAHIKSKKKKKSMVVIVDLFVRYNFKNYFDSYVNQGKVRK
jgi:hypothetical protein